jgi:hypothetical protein
VFRKGAGSNVTPHRAPVHLAADLGSVLKQKLVHLTIGGKHRLGGATGSARATGTTPALCKRQRRGKRKHRYQGKL